MSTNPIFILCFCLISFSLYAQRPTIQDCLGAIPVCQRIYEEANSPTGTGNFPNEINELISCSLPEDNTVWYTFTVNNSGDFGFLITPNNRQDDYDWWLFDVTGGRCADIDRDAALTVSCNVAGEGGGFGNCHGATGATGQSNYDQQGTGCGFFPADMFDGDTPFNDLIPVQAGNTYALCISNYTDSPDGYKIDFGLSGNIGILDEVPPQIADITTPEDCGDATFALSFTERIQCSTIAAANFSLVGPGGPYQVSLSSPICDIGGAYDQDFTLTVNPPILGIGDFQLIMTTDNQTEVLDICGNPAATVTNDFSITTPTGNLDVDIGDATVQICAGQSLTLDATTTNGNYEWQDGSNNATFTVTEAGTYSVTVTEACNIGEASVRVEEKENVPPIDLGEDQLVCEGESITLDATVNTDNVSYLWSDGSTGSTLMPTESGTYSVTVSNDCNNETASVSIAYIEDFTVDLGEDQLVCEGELVTLDATVNTDNVSYLWSDGSMESTLMPTEAGTYSVTVSNDCNTQTASVDLEYIEDFTVDLGEDQLVCEGELVTLDATVNTDNVSYLWSDGSMESTLMPTEAGTYSVTVSNDCNTQTASVDLEYIEDFTVDLGEDQLVCEGESITLDATVNTDNVSYLWSDGSTESTLQPMEAGTYSVTVSNDCNNQTASVDITYIEDFTVDLGADRTACPDESVTLEVSDIAGNIEWSTGSTAEMITVAESGTYSVTVTTECAERSDEIEVSFGSAPVVDLGRDTILCTGESLTLDAVITDATYMWQDGSTERTLMVQAAGTYSVTVTTNCNTSESSVVVGQKEGVPPIDLGEDQRVCAGELVTLDATVNTDNVSYLWSDGSTESTLQPMEAGTYSVTVSNDCNTQMASVDLEYIEDFMVDLGGDRTACPGESVTLEVSDIDGNIEWSTGSTAETITVAESGTYSVTVTTECAERSDEIEVSIGSAPVVDLGRDTILCTGESLTLDAVITDATYMWQDGSTERTFAVQEAGTYSVTVTTNCNTSESSVVVGQKEGVPPIDLGEDQLVCAGESITLDATVDTDNVSYLWSDGSTESTLQPMEAGTYSVTVSNDCNTQMASVDLEYIEDFMVDLGGDRTACPDESVTLEVSDIAGNIEWSTGSTEEMITVAESGTYSVTVTTECAERSDEIEVSIGSAPIVDLGRDTVICTGEPLTLDAIITDATYMWQDGSTERTLMVQAAGTYSVTVTTSCNTSESSVVVGQKEGVPSIDLGEDRVVCDENPVTLDATVNADNIDYLWSDGSTQPTLTIMESGTYSVTVSNDCNSETGMIDITYSDNFTVDLGEDRVICDETPITLDATVNVDDVNYLWSDGSTEATLTIMESGTYSVTVSNECTSETSTIDIVYSDDFMIDLGEDQVACEGESVELNISIDEGEILWSTGSTAETITVSESGTYSVTVTTECAERSDEVEVFFVSSPNVDLGRDTSICAGEPLILDAALTNATYSWQDGSTERTFTVQEAGIYSVTVTTNCNSSESSIVVGEKDEVPPIEIDNQLICDGEPITLDATVNIANANYLWSDGSTEPTFTAMESGTYEVTVSSDCNSQTHAIVVVYENDFVLDLGQDQTICEGESIALNIAVDNAVIQWSTGSTENNITVSESGTYSVTVTTVCAERSDEIEVSFGLPPRVDLGRDTSLCRGESLTLDATVTNATYRWQDGSTEAIFIAQESGTYSVNVSTACGETSAEKRVDFSTPIEVNLGKDTLLCNGEPYVLDASNNAAESYVWEDGSTESARRIIGPGLYSVRVSNACEEVTAAIDILECTRCLQYIPNAFSPDGDGRNDLFQVFSSCPMQNYELRIFDRWGNKIYTNNEAQTGWDGSWKSRKMNAGVYVWYVEYTVEEDGKERLVTEAGEIVLMR